MLTDWTEEGIRAGREMRETYWDAEHALQQYATITESTAVRGRQLVELAPALFGGAESAGGATALGSHVGSIARRAQVRSGAISMLPDTTTGPGPFRRIRVSGSVEGDVTGVSRFLELVEGGLPVVRFQTLNIDQSNPQATPDQPERLRVTFVVEALAIDRRGGQ